MRAQIASDVRRCSDSLPQNNDKCKMSGLYSSFLQLSRHLASELTGGGRSAGIQQLQPGLVAMHCSVVDVEILGRYALPYILLGEEG